MRRAAAVLVMLAALCGAPSSVLGQAPPAATEPAALAQVGGHAEGPDTDQLLLLLGLVVGVAAVTLLAAGWLLTTRIRDDDDDTAAAAAEVRRARQRARAAGHDPVLAAMGLDEELPPSDPTDR